MSKTTEVVLLLFGGFIVASAFGLHIESRADILGSGGGYGVVEASSGIIPTGSNITFGGGSSTIIDCDTDGQCDVTTNAGAFTSVIDIGRIDARSTTIGSRTVGFRSGGDTILGSNDQYIFTSVSDGSGASSGDAGIGRLAAGVMITKDGTAAGYGQMALGLYKVTADPCGTLPEGFIFYNDTSNYMCFCDAAGDDIKTNDNTTACF